MSISASEARRNLFPLIEQVNDDRTAIEIVSRKGKRGADVGCRIRPRSKRTAYLLRSPENARRPAHCVQRRPSPAGACVTLTWADLEALVDQA